MEILKKMWVGVLFLNTVYKCVFHRPITLQLWCGSHRLCRCTAEKLTSACPDVVLSILTIIHHLHLKNYDVVFCWIPSHIGITGNEKADQAAKSALNLPNITSYPLPYSDTTSSIKQESPAIADKSARRESLPKIAPIRRAYNVVADNTGLSSFV